MRLRVGGQSLNVPHETRQAIERAVRLTLGRHAAGIDAAQITLSPAAPVRGGYIFHCRIHVFLREGAELAAEDHAEDLFGAAAGAAWRLEQRLTRHRANRLRGAD